ncbi:MAG: hypothetical protein P1P74_09450 [Desulfuromonadales bacterium]|nr:hypothetical protein [Desulfuromonadales bacterium]MDT8423526.1 hypothetical protein [Desulfuromonadales bacterium]
MLFHCTQKLSIKIPDCAATPLTDVSPLGSWHANLYRYSRRQCVLFCHDETRYCLLLAGLLKDDFAVAGHLQRELFLASLRALDVPATTLKRVTLALGPVQFDCNTNRSVLGGLRTADIDLSWLICDTPILECDPLKLCLQLNQRPTSIKGRYLMPQRAMLERVAQL